MTTELCPHGVLRHACAQCAFYVQDIKGNDTPFLQSGTPSDKRSRRVKDTKGMPLLPGGRTPRTDTEGVRFARIMVEWTEPGKQKTTELIPADFARELELELAEAHKRIAALEDSIQRRN